MIALLLVAVLIGVMDTAPCADHAGYLIDNGCPRPGLADKRV